MPGPPVLPRRLRPGDRVALVAPAGPVHPGLLEHGVAALRSWGLDPVEMPHTRRADGLFAGADDERLADLHAAWAAPDMAGIFCIRGGYGTQRLVDRLDWDLVAANPKVLVGFSDITALHLAVHARTGQVTFHGPNVEWTPERIGAAGEESLRRCVMEPGPLGRLPATGRTLVGGRAEGRLVGGNLSLMGATLGTADARGLHGALLLVEDVGERAYVVDRLLVQLARSGVLARAAGLVVGAFARPLAGRGGRPAPSLDEVVAEHADRLGLPAVAGMPLGHGAGQLTVPHGARAVLDADRGTIAFPEAATRD